MAENNYTTMEWREDLRPFRGIDPGEDFGRGTTLPHIIGEHGNGAVTTLPYIMVKPDFPADLEPAETGYRITDDGRLVPVTKTPGGEFVPAGTFPSDEEFRRYMEDTNDWGIYGGSRGDKPSFDEWRKSQPGYDPDKDDNGMELPDEVMEAIRQAAEEAGMEQPWSFDITAENCPDLFEKIDQMYKEANPSLELTDGHDRDPGFIRYLEPDTLPEDIIRKFEEHMPDPNASPYYEPIELGTIGLTPEELEEIHGKLQTFQPELQPANQPDPDSPFYGILNGKIAEIDLDKAFEGIEAPSLSGAVIDAPTFRPELLGGGFMPDEPTLGPEDTMPEPTDKVWSCDFDVM